MKAYNALSAYGGDQDNAQLSYQPTLLRYTWAGYCKPTPVLRTTMWQRLGTIDRGIAIFSATRTSTRTSRFPNVAAICGRSCTT